MLDQDKYTYVCIAYVSLCNTPRAWLQRWDTRSGSDDRGAFTLRLFLLTQKLGSAQL